MYARMYRDVRADVQRSWAGEIRFYFLQFVFKFDFALLETSLHARHVSQPERSFDWFFPFLKEPFT